MLLLYMLAVTSLAVYNAAASPPTRSPLDPDQYLIDDPPPPGTISTTRTIQCYHCDGEGDCNRNNLFLCETKHYICGTLARSPNFTSVLGCVTAKPKLCSLTYTRANNQLEFSCFCAGQICNSIFNEEIRKDLLKFYADFLKYVNLINDTDYTSLFYEMVGKRAPSSYSEVTFNWPLGADAEKVYHPIGAVLVPSIEPHVIYVNDAHAEALRQDATAASSDDEDDDEGSGAGIMSGAGSGVLVVVPKNAGAATAASAAPTAEPSFPPPPGDRDVASLPIIPAAAAYLTLAFVITLF